jgi:hypothetical protein
MENITTHWYIVCIQVAKQTQPTSTSISTNKKHEHKHTHEDKHKDTWSIERSGSESYVRSVRSRSEGLRLRRERLRREG